MYIKSLHIENFKYYKMLDLEFDKKINLIIGNNGAGKTSVLQAIRYALYGTVDNITKSAKHRFNEEDINCTVTKVGDATYSYERSYPCATFCGVEVDGDIEELGMKCEGNDYGRNSYQYNILYAKELLKNEYYPLLCYRQFDRNWYLANEKEPKYPKPGMMERKEGYLYCLSGYGYERRISEWCQKMAMIEFERRESVQELQTFQSIISRFMNVMEESEHNYIVRYSTEFAGLIYDDGITPKPFSNLSTGYQAILSIVMELAYRAVLLNPTIDAGLEDMQGIVIIDEIDAHLHPRWQWKILDALTKTYPDLQFIVATHSPMVISSAKNANLIVLEEDSASYLSEAYGYSVDDVLELRQGSLSKLKISEEYSRQLDEAIDSGEMEMARELVEEARNVFGEESLVYKGLWQYYKLNDWSED